MLFAVGDTFLKAGRPEIALPLLRSAAQFTNEYAEDGEEHRHLMATFYGRIAVVECKMANWKEAAEAMQRQLLEIAVKQEGAIAF